MKRLNIIMLILLLLLITALPGCTQDAWEKESKISVVCTVFPQYDWVLQILGDKSDNVNLTLLLKNRIDLHNYQPSVDDIIKISGCDLFIYIGGVSDGWVNDVLKQATNKNMVVVNLLDILGSVAKTEEIIDGMEEDDHEHEAEYDEHVWLSLKNTQVFCTVIARALSSLDAGNAEEYQSNLKAFIKKISALNLQYQKTINEASVKVLLFGDRFPFRYLVDDYGLNYYAAFVGCSAETEASFETIVFLTKKMDELSLKNIMVTESSNKKIAETIIRESKSNNQKILVLDSMQSVTLNDVANGVTYLSIMENNLNVLKEALR